ncbi:MAG: alanine racemase, partial [bacterium]
YHNLSVSVIHSSILQPLEDAAESMGKVCHVHLKVNVGLNRLGITPSKIFKIAGEAVSKKYLRLEGLFAQPRDNISALDGFRKFKDIYEKLKSKNIAPRRLHFANSTCLLSHPQAVADGVRLGILLYGVSPPDQYRTNVNPLPLKPQA